MKILYIHELGSTNKKADRLRELGHDVVVPHMELGWDFLFKIKTLGTLLLLIIMFYLTFFWTLLISPIFYFILLDSMFLNAVELQQTTISNHQNSDQPIECVVASSFGGAIALYMLHHDRYHISSLIISPSHQLIGKYCSWSLRSDLKRLTIDPMVKCLLVHGIEDKLIPITDSEILAKENHLQLIRIKDGDHSLDNLKSTDLADLLEQLSKVQVF